MRWRRVLLRILDGRHDAAIRFEDLCRILLRLGFDMHIRGSHHIFRMPGIPEQLNLQADGHLAKAYQVRQVRRLIQRHRLGVSP